MNEAEMVDVALGILIEVTSVLSLLTPMAGDCSRVGTSIGLLLLVRQVLPGCLGSHIFLFSARFPSATVCGVCHVE